MGALIWFIVAAILAVLELAVGEMTLLMIAAGALTTSAVALAGVPLAVEVVAFAASSLAFWLFLRPPLRKRLDSPKVLDETPRALVGQTAEVVEPIVGGKGQVRLEGSLWSARSLDPAEEIPAGRTVTVYDIDGPVAVVWKET